MAFQIKTYFEIFAQMKTNLQAKFPGALLVDRSALLTLVHAAALQDAEQYLQMARILESFDVNTATGQDLDRRLLDYNLLRKPPLPSSVAVTFADSRYTTKVQSTTNAVVSPASIGIVLITGGGTAGWGTSGSVILSRSDAALRETLPYTGVVGDILTLGAVPTNTHPSGSSVIKVTSGTDQVIAGGTEVYTSATGTTEEISFETTAGVTLLDGDVVTPSVVATCQKVGTTGNVGANTIVNIRSLPWPEATVNNPTAAVSGRDRESDTDARARVKLHVQGINKGTPQSLQEAATTITKDGKTVLYVQVEEPVTIGRVTVWINDGSSTLDRGPTTYDATQPRALVYNASGGETLFRYWDAPLDPTQAVKLVSSSAQGTATSVGPGTLTDAAASFPTWTVPEYWLVDGAGQIWDITSNTATQLNVTYLSPPVTPASAAPGTPSSGPYSIVKNTNGSPQEKTTGGGGIFDISTYPASQPTASDRYLLNYMTGEIQINAASGFTVPVGGSVVLKTFTATSGLWKEAVKVLNGVPNDLENYPGFKAAGVYLDVGIPNINNITFSIAISVESGFTESQFYTEVKNEVMAYVNNLNIGENVYISEIIKLIKEKEGILDVSVTSPPSNVIVLPGSMARTSASLISVT